MQNRFMLTGSLNGDWYQKLAQVLRKLGGLTIASEEQIDSLASEHTFDVIIVDAGAVEDATAVVQRLVSQHPEAKIIAITSSPTWARARDILRAGAADYIRKPSEPADLLPFLNSILENKLSTR